MKQILFASLAFLSVSGMAQSSCFDFGNGSNGAYNATTNTTIAGGTYDFTTFNIDPGVTVGVTGTQPLIIRCTGAVTINGTLTARGGNGGNGVTFSTFGIGGVGVAGGGNGGNGVYLGSAAPGSAGSGLGGVGNGGGGWSGGGGAGYSAVGASSGSSSGGFGGPIYGNANISGFEAGSGGGGGSGGNSCGSGGGGAGGGLIYINSAVSITIGATGLVNVNGGNGGTDGGGNCGGGGGGSGGSIIMQSPSMTHNGTLQASGGAGGASNVPGNPYYGVGGVGAPGRIRLDYNGALNGSGTITPAVGAHYTVSVLTTMAVATQNVSCAGGNNGSALATVMNGNAPYTYAWSPSGGNSTLATGLSAGTYTFTVTDALGCTAAATVSVTEPPALTASVSGVDILCNGGNSGQTTVVAGGGVPTYSYSWSPSGSTSATQTNLTAGCYSVTVTDMNNCSATQSICITEPSALSATTTVVNPTCNGGCDGTGTITVTGGVAPYQYLWCNGETSANPVALCEMPCTINITDANGCSTVDFVTIIAPPPVQVNVLGADTTLCHPASITVCAPSAVTYMWSDGSTSACVTTDTSECLFVRMADLNGCITIDTICITDDLCLSITETSETEFSITPNPASEFIIITHGQTSAQRTEVYDAQGRIVKSVLLNNRGELNVSDLAPGIYSVKVGDNTARLVIE